MSASASKDVIKTMKSISCDTDPIQNMNYDEMWKSVSGFAGSLKEFHYCPSCSEVFPDNPDIVNCETEGCGGLRYQGTDQTKNGRQPLQKFAFADMKSQLKLLLECPGIWRDIQKNKEAIKTRMGNGEVNIGDITDGAAYRKMCAEGEFLSEATNLSAVMNTDGVNLYSSSKVELWPIFIAINEISPAWRFARENMVLVGIWQGKGKPPFQQYLNQFAIEVNKLKADGFTICVNHESFLVKLAVVCTTVDLPAKASVLNMTYFNGKDGCITCEESGMTVQQGKGTARCYPFDSVLKPIRKHDDVVKCMTDAAAKSNTDQVKHRVKGFRGRSGLMSLDGFDLVQGIVPDYMHGLFLGITKALMSKWFSPTQSKNPYFVGKQLAKIGKRLKGISPPDFIERLPRDLEKNYAHFKATELQTWLLYYCIPCLHGILPHRYLQHVAKLSEAAHTFLGDSISPAAMARSSTLLNTFYSDFVKLYGGGSCGLNVHNAGSHLADYVRQWGPMWAWSCFAFEDANAMILQSVHGTGDVIRQVIKFKLAQSVTRKHGGMDRKHNQAWTNLKTMNNCSVAGKIKDISDTKLEKQVVEKFDLLEAELKKVSRVVVGGCKFYSAEYTRMQRRECTVVCTDNNEFGKVLLFLVQKEKVYAVIRLFQKLTKIRNSWTAHHSCKAYQGSPEDFCGRTGNKHDLS